jgi:hypothetical protein
MYLYHSLMVSNEPDCVFSYFVALSYIKLLRGFVVINVTEIEVVLVSELDRQK